MNESQVKTFLTVARLGSMGRAAEELFITQPAIKKQLDALDAELGVRLLDRTRHGCALTEAGERFAHGVAPLADGLAALKKEVARTAEGPQSVSLCVLPGMVSPHFGEMCALFVEHNPGMHVDFVRMQYPERPEMISRGRADVGVYFLVPSLLESLGLRFWPIPRGDASSCMCLVGAESPLRDRDRLQVSDLVDTPLATFDPAPLRPIFEELERRTGARPCVRTLCSDGYEIMEFCAAGGAYLTCHLPSDISRETGLYSAPVEAEMPPEGFITRKDPSRATLEFIRCVADVWDEG